MRCPALVSPDLTVGRGLKHGKDVTVEAEWRIARPHGRARIETSVMTPIDYARLVSPDLTVGRGLKRDDWQWHDLDTAVSPDLTVGRGLKPGGTRARIEYAQVSPDLTVGRGLKQN